MSDSAVAAQPKSALVFGARNLGRAVVEVLLREGWQVAAAARSDATSGRCVKHGALAVRADVTDASSVEAALAEVAEAYGPAGSVVNAPKPTVVIAAAHSAAARSYKPARRSSMPGRWRRPALPSGSCRGQGGFLLAQAAPATLIQVTGGSARRAMPGRGLWAAGSFGVRALTHASALELRGEGIHVALLIIDAGIEPMSGEARPG